jgi:hypothetical protein
MRGLGLVVAIGLLAATRSSSAGKPANPYFPHGSLPYEPCLRTEECRKSGRCRTLDERCVAARDDDCLWSAHCRDFGLCSFNRRDRECDDGARAADKGMLTGAIVTLGVGGLALVFSVVPFMFANLDCAYIFSPKPRGCGDTGKLVGGLMAGGGSAIVGISIPLFIVGGRRVQRAMIGRGFVAGSF